MLNTAVSNTQKDKHRTPFWVLQQVGPSWLDVRHTNEATSVTQSRVPTRGAVTPPVEQIASSAGSTLVDTGEIISLCIKLDKPTFDVFIPFLALKAT